MLFEISPLFEYNFVTFCDQKFFVLNNLIDIQIVISNHFPIPFFLEINSFYIFFKYYYQK